MKSEWGKVNLGDVCDLIPGFAFKSKDFGSHPTKVVKIGDIQPPRVAIDCLEGVNLSSYSPNKLEKYLVTKGDFVLAMTGATIGKLGRFLADKPAYINQRVLRFKPKENVDWNFIYYVVNTKDFSGFVYNHIDSETAQPNISAGTLATFSFSIPPLPIQRKLASILSALDDKIETNNAICRNLEELMESMYNKLFVENYNSEWTQGTISDLGRIVGGGTPSKKEPSYYTQQGISWITPKDLSRNTAKFIQRGEVDITQEGLNASGATIMPAGTVLFSSRAPIGYMAIACNDVTTNQGFKSVIPHDFVGSAYLYYFLKANKNAIEMRASGSTFLEVSAGIMRQVPAIIPDKSTLDIFKHFCNPLFEMQRKLETETVSLSQLRESLLPKLMSGELSIDALN